jgi:hypothetical protein
VPAGFLRFSRLAVSLAGYSTQNVALALTDLAAQPAALSSTPMRPQNRADHLPGGGLKACPARLPSAGCPAALKPGPYVRS